MTRPASTATPLPAVVATRITHTRRSPLRHTFTYRSSSWLIDVDDPPRFRGLLRLAADVRSADHFPEPMRPGQSLRQRLDNHLRGAGVTPADGPVCALLSPRVAGYTFNPLSVFWCHHADGTLAHVVAEVHNTYGERHCYIVTPDADGRAEVDKEFYVSPFHDVSGRYRLRVPEPDGQGRVAVSIILDRPGAEPFVAALTGHARPATTRAIVGAQLRTPLAPLVVSARIRLQGIGLWARRLPVQPRPDHPVHSTLASTATKGHR
ncbi:MAG TPA: DUF1365 domain-containing protein [Gordonia polyisoprenivorans]|uniref:DUF1365 domain-containing protein n=1 Tax=Gordonia polyisoprenivorans TaxID=84595 RepID=UPI000EB9CE2F|nr:DUF1365 domain-containing protein [Gordonia polyisoprenivorans]QUD82454.1 DUF1365 domain-containing protein [Gordonia polyisoprenivorans]HCS59662.1 DUF1365 domain-containing protein [Gordonia polyisoprenivorans]